ncbi:MAG: NAD-dependent epimerase/dehydratase family protein [Gallionellaceae bacterium]
MSKILVTGASGFIGKSLVSKLQALGRDVVPVASADGDIASRKTLGKFAQQDIAHVFHLAGKTFVPDSWDDPQAFCQTNVLGTVNVLEFCRKSHVPMTCVSAYVYGHPDTLPIGENSAIRPSNPYALSKRLAEEVCEFYASAYDLPVTTIRPFNVFGIGQDSNFLIPSIIRQALNEPQITVKDLLPKRDYVYLEDLLAALLLTLNRQKGYSIYNVGSGNSLSVKEVIDVIQDVAGTHKEIISDNVARTNELMDVVADISKSGRELGWYPEYSFRAGIEKIIQSEWEKRKHEQA